ncbi:MAG: FtsX-like permease family protein [Candidatus Symbiothrix sp.]|jgi:ABC-type lipoprotein release transport system permease subunit|nr:FtsX-like permease family protein [Candidatus Symbiothrix sp.]
MIINLAWKNIWRNKTRSFVIIGAIALGLFSGTYLSALMTGWVMDTVNADIKINLSHVQIHDSTFLQNSDIGAFFNKTAVEQQFASSNINGKMTCRLKLNGMLASANNAVGVTAKGIFKDTEMTVSDIATQIPDSFGVFLPDDARMPVVISEKTAEKLKVRLKSKIVFTFSDIHGNMQSLAFRVSGIFHTSNGLFDEANVFVRYNDIFPVTGLPDEAVHEAAVLLPDIETCALDFPKIKDLYPQLKVQDWKELNPMLSMSLQWTNLMSVIIISIFLFALTFGIINTMLMAVLERTRELGMLGAIGMSKRKIFSMIMLETVFLTFVGSIIGIILAVALLLPSLQNGLDLTPLIGNDFEDFGGFSSIVYPILNVEMILEIIGLVILAGILSAIYPARKALKLKALDAIRV